MMKKHKFLLIPTLALILMIFAILVLITPMLINMVVTPIGSHDDTAAYNLALSGLEFAAAENLEADTSHTLIFSASESCSIDVTATTITATATAGGATRILSEPYSPTVTTGPIGDIAFIPGEITESINGSISDNSGNGNTATPSDLGLSSTPHPMGGTDVTVLDFNDNNSKITIDGAAKESLQFTNEGGIAFWLNLDDASGDRRSTVVYKSVDGKTGDKNVDWAVFVDLKNSKYKIEFWVSEGTGKATKLKTAEVFNTGQWYHLAFAWDANGMRIYTDGTLYDDNNNVKIANSTDGNIYWGNENNKNNAIFKGLIYYPVILSRAFVVDDSSLESVEVRSLYQDRRLYYSLDGTGLAAYPSNNNESSTGKAIDGTIFLNHGVLGGGPDTTAKNSDNVASKAYSFDATSNQGLRDSKVFFELIKQFTVIGSINLTNYDGNMGLMNFDDHFKITLSPSANGYNVKLISSTITDLSLTAELTAKTGWHHIAVVSDGDKAILYLDGINRDEKNLNGNSFGIISNKVVTVGSNLSAEHFDGSIDEFAIYGRALTEIEVSELLPEIGLTPFAHWTFEENTGTTTDDIVGNNDADLIGDPTWTTGKIGNALSFDGTNDRVVAPIGNSFLNDLQEFTISGWFKSDATGGNRIGLWGQNDVIEIGINSNKLNIWTPTGGSLTIDIPTPTGEWYNFTCVGTGSSLKMYLNGELISTGGSNNGGSYGSSNFGFNIGGAGIWDPPDAPNGDTWFEGEIDDVRVYKEALTTEQIKELYDNAGIDLSPYPVWQSTTIYNTANTYVQHNGKLYYNRWWIQTTEPGTDSVWFEVSDYWVALNYYGTNGTVVKHNGSTYQNKWPASPGQEPGVNSVWEEI